MTSQPATIGRYELLDELPHVFGGRLFRARDLAFSEIVAIKQLDAVCGLSQTERRPWEDAVRHRQNRPHPHLVRLDSFDATAGVLVREWIEGISLLDLLRHRRHLPANEALTLLATLPETLDFLSSSALPVPRPLLRKLFIECADPTAVDRFRASSAAMWPPFKLKLNALGLRALITAPSIEDTAHSFSAHGRAGEEFGETQGPREFARLLYELVGGRIHELDARRYSPIGALREAGNAVLERTLFGKPPGDCQTLWRELFAAQPGLRQPPPQPTTTAAHRILTIPAALLSSVQAAVVLDAIPLDPNIPPIRLVARPRFNIGRSAQHADYVARLQPENEFNNVRTHRLSRVHVHLNFGADGLEARDGSGSGPSLNGSSLDGQPLRPDSGAPLARRSLLCLGEEYALELIHVRPTDPPPFEITNLGTWAGPESPPAMDRQGALVCLPADGQSVTRHCAWIFAEAGFGLDPAGNFVWDTRGHRASPATFRYHRGCFWLQAHAGSPSPLSVDDTTLGGNEIAPLTSGATLRLGPHAYRVQTA